MTDQNTRTLPYGEAALAEAAAIIAAGGCVAVPTETVYGLAADAGDSRAVAGIYAAKGRPRFNPLIIHVADADAAGRLAQFDARAGILARRFWPGPLTLVLTRRDDAPIASLAVAGLASIALRVPAHRAMQGLIAACARPLAAPSANASGTISPTHAYHVLAGLGGRIPMILDDGPTVAGLESTIVALTGGIPRLLRPGPISIETIEDVLGEPLAAAGPAIEAPGMLASHYAPTKPVRLNAIGRRNDEWLIGFGAVVGDDSLSTSGDLVEAATRLFDCLHRADAGGATAIAIAPVPDRDVGAAINDRLRRAAAPRADPLA